MGTREQDHADEVQAVDAAEAAIQDDFSAPEGAPLEIASTVDVVDGQLTAEEVNDPDFRMHNLKSMVFLGEGVEESLVGHFNTFRIGSRWASLQYCEPVLFMKNDLQGEGYQAVQGFGRVMAVHLTTLANALMMHTGCNQLFQVDQAGRDMNPLERRAVLKDVLEKSYGKELDGSELCTVVYFNRDVAEYRSGA